jgi:predicted CXXCH cytochrome family protein
MARKGGAELCGSCHGRNSATLRQKHPGMNVQTADCLSCHDPHVQKKGARGLLRPGRDANPGGGR